MIVLMNMKCVLAVIILLFGRFSIDVYAVGSGTQPDPLQKFVKKGHEAILQCKHEHSKLTWDRYLNGKYVTIADGHSTKDSTKHSVSVNSSTGLPYKLHVLNAQPADEGVYRCDGEYYILLNLYVPPSRLYFNGSAFNKLEGIEGTNLLIRCIAKGGKPPPEVSILHVIAATENQEISHTIPKIERYYHQRSITCNATSEALETPMTTTVQIILNLKPLTPIFNTNEVSTEETVPLNVSCTSYGSRPAATFTWTIGGKNFTSSSTISSTVTASNDTKTVMSTLTSSVDRSNDKQIIICHAANTVGNSSSKKVLDVKHAPDITVNNITYTQNDAIRTVTCNPSGNPVSYTYQKWQHKSKYGELIREFDGDKILKLPDDSVLNRYQDSGEYVCTASNGINDRDHNADQEGSGYVIVNAPPIITADNNDKSTQYGKFGQNTKIYVNVYSVPKYSSIHWYKGDKEVPNKYVTKDEPAIVEDLFHGVKVQLDGYRVTLSISYLQEADFTNYTLRLYYNSSHYVKYGVTLESASAPETPSNFTITSSRETSITVQWIPGYDGGQTQTFYIEYRVTGSSKWMSHEIKTSNQLDTHSLYTLSGLQDKTSYELRMYATNKFNQSQHTDIETIRTPGKANSTALGGVIGGVAGGLVVVIAILILIVFVLFKRKTGTGFPSKRTRLHSDSEVEEGLKDNVLYEGSEPEGLKVNILYQSAGPDSINKEPNAEYAEVSKPPTKPIKSSNDEYAEVQKQNDEVDKKAQQKNVKKKKQTDKKKPPKSGKTRGGALNNNPDGEYANSGIPMGNMSDGAYSNAENQSAGNKKNDQGLEYADLTFGSQIPKGKQPVLIHGDENRTIYSEVDHTKKAPPPPQESEYEETDIKHGKK